MQGERQLPGKPRLLLRWGVLQEHREPEEAALATSDSKRFVKLRGQEARLLCRALLSRTMVWRTNFFSNL